MNCIIELVAKFVKVKFGLGFLAKQKVDKSKISLEEVETALISLGIDQGDSIIVHSSLSRISAVAEEVVILLQSLVGPTGNILMPTHPQLSKIEDGILIYDPKNSKSRVGYLTEYFRNLPEVERSLHPFASVAVLGQDKKWFLDENNSDDATLPHGKDSPYNKLAEKGGKAVCIGVTAKNRATIKHTAEEIMDREFPLDIFEEVSVIVRDDRGGGLYKKFRRTIPFFSEIYMCKSKIEKEWLQWGILKKEKINSVSIEVLDAQRCVKLMMNNIRKGSNSYPYAPQKYKRSL